MKKPKSKPRSHEAKKPAAKFAKMTPAQKRVAIAQDVIAGLKAKRLVASPGVYVQILAKSKMVTERDVKNGVELQAKLAKVKRCNVCALGGVFVAAVDRFNGIKCNSDIGLTKPGEYDGFSYGGEVDDVVMKEHLRKFFSVPQLEDIEMAFEGFDPNGCRINDNAWTQRIRNSTERMSAIMQNIIKHKGRFDITKLPATVPT